MTNVHDASLTSLNEVHLICHPEGFSFRGLSPIDCAIGVYRSADWLFPGQDALKLKGGYLYFHDSSAKRSTFAGQILDVVPVEVTKTHIRVAFVVQRIKEAGVPWRGKKPTQKNPTGGIVPRPFNHH